MALSSDALAVFPLFSVSDGKCGCGNEKCQAVGKHPLVSWSKLAVGEKWAGPEGCGYGIATGHRSGLFVVDVDLRPEKNGLENLRALGEFPDTYTVRTPTGGFHFYFQLPDFPVKTSGNQLAKGVDVRGEGGYVVAPGSPHRNGGIYTVELDVPLATAPDWLLAWPGLRGAARTSSREPGENAPVPITPEHPDWERRISEGAAMCTEAEPCIMDGRTGNSNRLLILCARLVRTLELPLDVAYGLLTEHFNPRCDPPWSEQEIVHKLEDARDSISWQKWPPGKSPDSWQDTIIGLKPASASLLRRLEGAASSDPTALADGFVQFLRGDQTEISEKLLVRFPSVVFVEEAWYDYDAKRGIWYTIGVENEMRQFVMSLAGLPIDDKELRINLSDVNGAISLTEARRCEPLFFDSAVNGLACKNGFVRVDGSLVPHDAAHRARSHYPIDYQPGAEAPAFVAFLEELFAGDADAEAKAGAVLEFFGGCLFGLGTRGQKCILAIGGGANGKSTLVNILSEMFPEESISALSPRAWGVPARVCSLSGKLLNVCGELPRKDLLESDAFKSVIVGDRISASPKYKDEFRFRPIAGHFFSTNELPATSDQSDGFWRRFIVLTFNRKFEGDAADAMIDRRILSTDRSGILAMLVAGAGRVHARLEEHQAPYTRLPSGESARTEWQTDSDTVLTFLRDMAVQSEKGTKASVVYLMYKAWAETYGHRPLSSTSFGKRMKAARVEGKKANDGYWYFVDVRTEPMDPRDAVKLTVISGGKK